MKLNFFKNLKKEHYIIIALFLITIFIRIIFKNGSLYHWDSLKDAIVIEDTLKTGTLQYSYAYGAPGMVAFVFIFYLIDHLITGTMSAEAAYFFATFLTAGLSVVLLYLIGKKVTKDQFTSLAAALILSFNVIFLTVTTYPKTHAIALFFTLMSFYLILEYNKKPKSWLLVVAGACFGLSVAIRVLNVLMILPILFIYLNPKKKGNHYSIKKYKLSITKAAYFIISSLLIWFLLFYNKISELGGLKKYVDSLIIEQNAAVGWQGLFTESLKISLNYIYKSITIVGLLLLAVGVWYGFKKYKKLSILLLLWIIPSLLYLGNILIPQARFFIIIFPAISIYIALGNKYVYNKNKLIGILVLIILILTMFITAYPLLNYRHDYSGPKDFALWVKDNTEENAVIIANDLGWFIEYYGGRKVITHPRSGESQEIQIFIEKLKEYSKEGIPIYSTEEGLGIDPSQKVARAIDENFNVLIVGEKESEIYQYSELELRKYKEKLLKLEPKFQ